MNFVFIFASNTSLFIGKKIMSLDEEIQLLRVYAISNG